MVGRLISISDSIARQPVCSQGFQTFLSSTPRCFPPFAVAVCRKRVFEDLARAICNLKQSSFALLEWVSQSAQNRRCTAMGYSSIEIDNLFSLSLWYRSVYPTEILSLCTLCSPHRISHLVENYPWAVINTSDNSASTLHVMWNFKQTQGQAHTAVSRVVSCRVVPCNTKNQLGEWVWAR